MSGLNKSTSYRELGLNLLSICHENNKQYVLAYLPVKWNIKDNCLEISNNGNPKFNSKFKDSDPNNPEEWQINDYLTEDQQELLLDFEKNYAIIHDILCEKINNSQKRLDDTAELLFIEKNKALDIIKEYSGIRKMFIENNLTRPISAFFGELEYKKTHFKEKGFCLINNNLNPSQLLSLFLAIKDDVTFVQGPPGTGKTSTVMNTITTAFFNKMRILVVTNNNKPMKDLKKKFDELGFYKNEKIELPVCRLSAKDKMGETIKNMKYLYQKYQKARVSDEILDKNSSFQRENLKEIINKMNEIDEILKHNRIQKNIELFIRRIEDFSIQWSLALQSKIVEEKNIDAKEVNNKINQTENVIKSFLYFYSAKCLQKLDKEKYRELKEIIDIDTDDEKQLENAIEMFIGYISDDEKLGLLLDVFPIVLSTNLSANKLASPKPHFDICIMDEAGQCNVATSLIPIVRAEKLMLVGDVQQLKPVIILNESINNQLKTQYEIKPNFCYISNSIYSTLKENAPMQRETLLDEHYRCNKKIIDFCNKKYYQEKLKILSLDNSEEPLEFINIVDEKRGVTKNVSLNEVKEVIKILQRDDIVGKKVGIITPYVVQKKVLEKEIKQQIKNVDFDIGTIHTFQGDEKEVIIFSTAITNNTTKGTYNWLKGNKQLINVAVSRSISKLILLGNENAIKKLHSQTIKKDKDDIYELYEHIITKGKCSITPNTISCEALGTEEEGNFIDKSMYQKIALSLSVIGDRSRYKEKVNYKELLKEETVEGKFDFVIYNDSPERTLAIIVVKLSQKASQYDKLKEKCESKGIDLLLIESNEIRSYYSIKDLLKEELKKKL